MVYIVSIEQLRNTALKDPSFSKPRKQTQYEEQSERDRVSPDLCKSQMTESDITTMPDPSFLPNPQFWLPSSLLSRHILMIFDCSLCYHWKVPIWKQKEYNWECNDIFAISTKTQFSEVFQTMKSTDVFVWRLGVGGGGDYYFCKTLVSLNVFIAA